jgi:hypothetical protein
VFLSLTADQRGIQMKREANLAISSALQLISGSF